LTISTERSFSSKKSEIDISNMSKSMFRYYINSFYIRGDDEIKIKFKDSQMIDMIQQNISFNIGFAIVDQGKSYCIIKDLSGSDNPEFENTMKRVFFMILSFGEDGLELIKKNQPIAEFWKRDFIIDKYIYYSLRMLNKRGHPDFQKTNVYFDMLVLLEHLADEYNRLYRFYKGKGLSKETIKVFEKTNQMFRTFYEVCYKYDLKKAESLIKSKKEIRKSMLSIKKESEEAVLYYLSKISELIIDIFQIQLQLEV